MVGRSALRPGFLLSLAYLHGKPRLISCRAEAHSRCLSWGFFLQKGPCKASEKGHSCFCSLWLLYVCCSGTGPLHSLTWGQWWSCVLDLGTGTLMFPDWGTQTLLYIMLDAALIGIQALFWPGGAIVWGSPWTSMDIAELMPPFPRCNVTLFCGGRSDSEQS